MKKHICKILQRLGEERGEDDTLGLAKANRNERTEGLPVMLNIIWQKVGRMSVGEEDYSL